MALTIADYGEVLKVTGTTDADKEIWDSGQTICLRTVYWFRPATAGHLVNLTDFEGNDVIPLHCISDGVSVGPYEIRTFVKGLRCNDMDSGTLYLYVDRR